MRPPTAHETIRRAAAENAVLLRASDLGVSPDAMVRMEQEGVLERVIPGIYIGTRYGHHPLIEAAAWAVRYPRAVAALLTAAAYHELTDSFSGGTWLYVARGASRPRSRVALVNVVQTAGRFIEPAEDRENGIESIEVHGVQLRVTGPDRTTLDLWRYPRRVTPENALVALRRRARSESFHLPAFARLGRRLRVWSRIEPIVQGLVLR